MSEIRKIGPMTSGAAVGGDGVATANTTFNIRVNGLILGFYVKYLGSPPAGTTDVTIATAGTADGYPAVTLLAITNAATDGYFPVQAAAYDAAGAANGQYVHLPVDDFLKVTIAGANAADYAQVWAMVIG